MKQEHGFTMLEILISIIVIMIGILGIAGIQMLSINNTEIARYQSLAAILASSMAADIQGNTAYWATSTANISIVGGVVTNGPTPGNCVAAICSPAQQAGYDLQNFATQVYATQGSGVLPAGQANISCTVAVGTPTVCALQIQWLEKNVALNNQTNTGAANMFTLGTTGMQSYQTEVPVQ